MNEQQWIDYFGFQRFPFDRPEAGNEEFARPDFLASCFVEPRSFARILGQTNPPATAILLADRGSGKTACRVMIDYFCRQGLVKNGQATTDQTSYVLSVPHIYLYQVLEMARQRQTEVRVEHHATEILLRAVPAFAELIVGSRQLHTAFHDLSPSELVDLSWLVSTYSTYLLASHQDFFEELGFNQHLNIPRKIGFPATNSKKRLSKRVVPNLQDRGLASPLDHLAQWTKLIRRVGVAATYVLVDGVDELAETASDAQACLNLLRPLLASLRLMDSTPHLAFKFFLPSHLQPLLQADPTIRKDRLTLIEEIKWREVDLIEILRRRLDVLKHSEDRMQDRIVAGFDALCVPDLRGQIEHDLAIWAQGNPRYLMLLCGFMVAAHCAGKAPNQDDPYQLNRQDLQTALMQFDTRIRQTLLPVRSPVPINLKELIGKGEGEQVEFKSTLRWDLRTQSVNKTLGLVIAKSIAGMLNSVGGTLLIGVADDGQVLSLAHDLKTLPKPTMDGFQLALIDAIKTYLGLEQMIYLRVQIEWLQDQPICAVLIQKSNQPVYVHMGDASEFWVRTGNSTRRLDVKAAMHYIQRHWGKLG